jgi:hypothetical protein
MIILMQDFSIQEHWNKAHIPIPTRFLKNIFSLGLHYPIKNYFTKIE